MSRDWRRISSRWATKRTRLAPKRSVSNAASQVFPSPVARTTRPAWLPSARVCLERFEGFLLNGVGLGRWRRLFGGDGDRNGNRDLGAGLSVVVNPSLIQARGHGVVEELFEGSHHRFESVFLRGAPSGTGPLGENAVVPLDAFFEGRTAQVGASHVGHTVSQNSKGTVKDVGLGMEVSVLAPEDTQLDVRRGFFFEIEQADESVGLGDAEVVAGEKAQATVSIKKLAEVGIEKLDAASENEGNDQIGAVGPVEMSQEVGEERIVLAANERLPMRGRHRFDGE